MNLYKIILILFYYKFINKKQIKVNKNKYTRIEANNNTLEKINNKLNSNKFIYFSPLLSNINFETNIFNSLYYKRLFEIFYNKIRKNKKNKKNKLNCIYCNGSGYLKCNYCKNGCWRCNNTTLLKCFFCYGSGEGRYAYIKSYKKL